MVFSQNNDFFFFVCFFMRLNSCWIRFESTRTQKQHVARSAGCCHVFSCLDSRPFMIHTHADNVHLTCERVGNAPTHTETSSHKDYFIIVSGFRGGSVYFAKELIFFFFSEFFHAGVAVTRCAAQSNCLNREASYLWNETNVNTKRLKKKNKLHATC